MNPKNAQVKVKEKKESGLLQPENGTFFRRRAVKIRSHYLSLFFLSFLFIGFFLIGIQKEATVDTPTAESSPLPLSSVRYWAYQIQGLDTSGAIDKIVNSKYDMVIIEPTVTYDPDFDARDMVNRIKASKYFKRSN
jgi:hypothetical protein